MTYLLDCFISLRARRLKAAQARRHLSVPINQLFRHPKLGVLVLQAHDQITQSPEYRPSNSLRAERLLDVFDRIIRLPKVSVRSRKVQPSKGLSRGVALG